MLFPLTPEFISKLTPTNQGLLSGSLDSALSLPALLDKNKNKLVDVQPLAEESPTHQVR